MVRRRDHQMDGRGSCCIVRHAAADQYYNPSKAHRIMLKFRPIAPKPPAAAAVNHIHHDQNQTAVMTSTSTSTVGRKRRRYRTRSSIKEQQQIIKTESTPTPAPAVTTTSLPVVRMVGSIVTVESLTDTWVVEYGLGYSDGERMGRLNEDDTCPGFVSDGFGRVVWTNGAYREMVRGGGGGGDEPVVSLVVKDQEDQRVLMGCGAAFTCRVRVQYYGCRSMTIPCDAWRMDGGGFAWRLDMKAALRL